MAVGKTRVRRMRIRKAIGRVSMTACAIAGMMLYLEVRGGATENGGQTPAVLTIEASPAGDVVPAASAGGQSVGVWAVEGSLVSLGSASAMESVSQGRGPVRAARVVVQGKDHHMATNAATVGQLLSAMGIQPDANDRVTPPPRTPLHSGSLVRVIDVNFKVVQQRDSLPAPTHTTYTTKLAPGKKHVLRKGKDGKVLRTYKRRIEDGKFVSKELVKSHVLVKPRAELVEVGRAPAPEPVAAGSGSVSGSGSGSGGSGASGTSGGSGHVQVGEASWYDHPGMTAASPSLPFGTVVRVTNVHSDASVTVTINDRGPFGGGRIIDLSDGAFAAIAPLSQGVCQVRLTW